MKAFIGNFPKDGKGKRKIEVEVHSWDLQNIDHTIAIVVLPLLKYLRKNAQSAPEVDLEDVPPGLRSVKIIKKNNIEINKNYFGRWKYVLDEMIWAFQQISSRKCYSMKYAMSSSPPLRIVSSNIFLNKQKMKRTRNGLRLFSKYYMDLWEIKKGSI